MIFVAAAVFLLFLTVVYLIVRPFVAPITYDRAGSLVQLKTDRERLRAQLRELDMDFETGKLAEAEYEKFRARRLQQIEATTRAIHEAEGTEEPEEAAGAEERTEVPAAELEQDLERRIAARKRALAELERQACPGCGTTINPDDQFCRRCGADLATPAETR
jgi:predicted  nucleic acid-binding Zn-ribbon protein